MQLRRVLFAITFAACTGKPARAPVPEPGRAAAPLADTMGTGSGSQGADLTTVGTGSGSPVPATSSAIKVTLADVGLEATSLDRGVDPCVDFFQFACGGWLRANPIPPDRVRWSRATVVTARHDAALEALLEEAAKGIGADPATKKLGDYYAACMDVTAIEQAGTTALKPMIDRITKVRTPRAWLAAVTDLHRLGIWVGWRVEAQAASKDASTLVTQLGVGVLGADPDVYLKPALAPRLDAYRAHVGKLLALAGTPAAQVDAAAADVVAIEVELARLFRPASDQAGLGAPAVVDAKRLGRQVRSVAWPAYWKALGVTPSKQIEVAAPGLVAGFDKLRTRIKPARWSSYFTFHLIHAMAFELPRAFDDEVRVVQGGTAEAPPRPRSQRCIAATRGALGDLLGARYVATALPPSARQAATVVVDAVVRALSEQLSAQAWMSAPTRQLALAKLGQLVRLTGHPDAWRTYDFEVRRDDFAGNQLRARTFDTRWRLGRVGATVDRVAWSTAVDAVQVTYDRSVNAISIPAGILERPYFAPDRSIAANLGGLGVELGHELTHGFDERGARYDASGNLKPWWPAEDAARFAAGGACVAAQYEGFEAIPNGFVQGRLTLAENVADLGGVKLAFMAYQALRQDAGSRYVADGFDEDQQFFIAAGQAACGKDRPTEVQRRLATDDRAPAKFRIYGALRNLPAFATAFRCAAGTPMNPANRCSVW